jgi:hypothetical protein
MKQIIPNIPQFYVALEKRLPKANIIPGEHRDKKDFVELEFILDTPELDVINKVSSVSVDVFDYEPNIEVDPAKGIYKICLIFYKEDLK